MKFEIKNTNNYSMYAGKIISYNITPIANIPMTWVTVTQYKEKDYFIDEQRFGLINFGTTSINLLKRMAKQR